MANSLYSLVHGLPTAQPIKFDSVPYDPARVDSPTPTYREQAAQWELLASLMEGTETMRASAVRWLPREEGESDKRYQDRVRRSWLYPGFKSAVRRIKSRPFSRPVTCEVEQLKPLDARLAELYEDVDGEGTSLSELAASAFETATVYGLTHVLVDWTATPEGATVADERALGGSRPLLRHVKPPDLLGWRSELRAGRRALTQIRFREECSVPDGAFGELVEDRIRVYGEDYWQVWVKRTGDAAALAIAAGASAYELREEGQHTFGGVPLVTLYLNQTGHLTAEPPLLELAETNVAHWQSSSDQRNITHWARVPILHAAGFLDSEVGKLLIGAGTFVRSKSEAAKLSFVEHSGKALDAGMRDLDRLERHMHALGLRAFIAEQSGDVKATATAVDEAQSQSDVVRWCRACEAWLLQVFTTAAKWLGKELPEDFKVSVFTDFNVGMSGAGDAELRTLQAAADAGRVDRKTYLYELQRRGILAAEHDLDAVIEAAESEVPPGMGGDDEHDHDHDEPEPGDDDDDPGDDDSDDDDSDDDDDPAKSGDDAD